MATGTVKWFSNEKGYGFISPDSKDGSRNGHEGQKDVFVHITAVHSANMKTLSEGQRVSFELENGHNGKVSAVNLQAIG